MANHLPLEATTEKSSETREKTAVIFFVRRIMKNDTVVIQHHPVSTTSVVKSSMPRTVVYRTNKEFDKCAELLRNILSVQESRRNFKPTAVGETNRKQQQQSSITTRPKKQNSKVTASKSTIVKTNTNNGKEIGERRSSYSPNKTLYSTGSGAAPIATEETSLLKSRQSPNKSRKHIGRSPSPTRIVHQRLTSPSKTSPLIRKKSPPSSFHHRRRRRRIQNEEELVRSSSCGDLPTSKFNFIHKEQTRSILDQFITHLTRIRTISKQIRAKNINTNNDSECYHLWNELESSLSSALSYANDDIQFQLSLVPLRSEIVELRKQLQTTNVHLHEYDLTHHSNTDQYVDLQKKFDTNQSECTQLFLNNEELKTKCYLLQDKLDHLERNNIRLIQRLTQQNLRSIAERTEWISTDNCFLLRQEIIFLKEKLYHVYDDLSSLFNRNNTLQTSIGEQKQQILSYKQQLNNLKQSAEYLLRDLDNRSMEEKMKRFLNNVIIDQHRNGITTSSFHQTHITPTKPDTSAVNSSSFLCKTPHKPSIPQPFQATTYRSRASPTLSTNKLRPKSLFITPTVLNDSKALSKFQKNRSPTNDATSCSSSTIDDADSTITSSSSTSLYRQQRKRSTLYNSLPSLSVPTTIDMIKPKARNEHIYNNESGPELDQISNLTSKMFSSGEEEEDVAIGDSSTSSSSSSIPSDAERLMFV